MSLQDFDLRNYGEHSIPMIKPTNTIRTNITQTRRDARGNRKTLCVALRLWGFEEPEVQSWMRELPELNGALSWRISRVRHASGADVVVHLVKPARRAKDAFCWNCTNANFALSQSLAAGGTEMILFAGNAAQLPPERAGHWAAAGKLPPQAALVRLGWLIAVSLEHPTGTHVGLRFDLLRMITQQLDAD
jgi:hypothetical protein